MLRVPELLLLESLKASDHILSTEEVPKLKVGKDAMFRDLDKARHERSLGPPISPPQPRNNAAIDDVSFAE